MEETMKSNYKFMLTAVGAFALGALAIQGLHAQMKPPAYFVAEVNVKDMDGFKAEFLPAAMKDVTAAGGKYLAGGFDKTMAFSGEPPPNRVVILQFENMAAAKAWQDGNGRATQKIGEKYATFRTFAVEGVEAK
jgi:uncharacterized protein (DUF1330 family)